MFVIEKDSMFGTLILVEPTVWDSRRERGKKFKTPEEALAYAEQKGIVLYDSLTAESKHKTNTYAHPCIGIV